MLTHAHGDHARAGSAAYLCTPETAALLRRRLEGARIETLRYGEPGAWQRYGLIAANPALLAKCVALLKK